MSAQLDSLLDRERLADIARHEAPAWHEKAVSRDASELSDNLHRQELLARQIAFDAVAARSAADAIKAISDIDFTPVVAAQIASVLSARITNASWGHWEMVDQATALLDDAHDVLGAV